MKKSHIMCISTILTDLCLTKQRIKTKNTFARVFLHCFSSENVLTEQKDICLSINGAQSVSKKRNNWVQKLFQTNASSIFVYANSDRNLESVKSRKLLIQKNMKIAFFAVLLTSLFVLMINLVNQLLFLKLQMLLTNLLNQFLKSISIVKK